MTNCSLTSYHLVMSFYLYIYISLSLYIYICIHRERETEMNAFVINVHANHSKPHHHFCTAVYLPNACLLRLSCLCCSLLSVLGWRFASLSDWVGPTVLLQSCHVHVAMFVSIQQSLYCNAWMCSTYTHMFNMHSK